MNINNIFHEKLFFYKIYQSRELFSDTEDFSIPFLLSANRMIGKVLMNFFIRTLSLFIWQGWRTFWKQRIVYSSKITHAMKESIVLRQQAFKSCRSKNLSNVSERLHHMMMLDEVSWTSIKFQEHCAIFKRKIFSDWSLRCNNNVMREIFCGFHIWSHLKKGWWWKLQSWFMRKSVQHKNRRIGKYKEKVQDENAQRP